MVHLSENVTHFARGRFTVQHDFGFGAGVYNDTIYPVCILQNTSPKKKLIETERKPAPVLYHRVSVPPD
jgi:hypothetical protein